MEKKVKLSSMNDVKEFVKMACRCDFDVDVFYNRVIIDAKSILGVLSMDLNQILTVRGYGNCDKFFAELSKFEPADEVA